MAISGNVVVVGACSDDAAASASGSVYLFNATTGALLATISNPTPAAQDNFGYSVAISGNTVVVAAPYDDTGATDSGSAYVFDAASGALTATLANPAPASADSFGSSVAISGNTVVVGADWDDTVATNSGSAYVFDATNGRLSATLADPTPEKHDYFGCSVAASGNRVLVGARLADYSEIGAGKAYVFSSGGEMLVTVTNPTAAAHHLFGSSVAISGNLVVVRGYGDTTAAQHPGVAYVLDWVSGDLVTTLASPSPSGGDGFGYSVAISGGIAVVGAIDADTGGVNSGAAYVFDANTGELLATLANPTPAEGDWFGCSVAITGATVVVGACYDDTGTTGSGSAYVFDAMTGALENTLLNPAPGASYTFGWSVAISGSTVVVGSPQGADGGVVYVFDTTTGALVTTLFNPAPAKLDAFGQSVAVSGNTVLVGVPADDAEQTDAGAAYVFEASSGALVASLANPTPWISDYFGYSVAIMGNIAAVGSRYDDTRARDSGSVYLFTTTTGELLATVANPTAAEYDYFGASVAASTSTLVVGAPGEDGLSYDRGAVYLFDGGHIAPSKITLSSASVCENKPAGTAIGTFYTTDLSLPEDSHTYTLVAGTGSADNASFMIVGSELRTAIPLDYESRSSYSIRVRTTDSSGGWYEEEFTIAVSDANDAPVLSAFEDQEIHELATLSFQAHATDQDVPSQSLTYSLDTVSLAMGMSIDPATGLFSWTPSEGQRGATYRVTITVTDNGVDPADLSDHETFRISVAATTTTVVASDHPGGSMYGETVTFTTTVGPDVGDEIPTGSVQFVIDDVNFGSSIALVNGTASIAVSSLGAGAHSIDAFYTSDDLASFDNSQTASSLQAEVARAPLTITADDRSKTYGETVTFAGTEFTANGLVNDDTVTGVTLNSAGAVATAVVSGSPYAIEASAAVGTGLGNYTITYAAGELSVTRKAMTITADDRSKTYGETVTFAGTEFTANGLVNDDTVTGVTLNSAGAVATAVVSGSPYSIEASAAAGTGLENYQISYVAGELTVARKAMTITADDRSKTYGETVTFAGTEFTANGLVNDDTVTSVTLNSAGAVATAVVSGSPYAIEASAAAGTGLGNYTISYAAGELTVARKALTITADDQSIVYGAALPALTASYEGFVNGDTVDSLDVPVALATAATSGGPVGEYAITASEAAGANYTITFVGGTLTISKAHATVAVSSSIPDVAVYGQPVTFTVTVSAVEPSLATPTGKVVFKDDTRALALVTLNDGVARFTTTSILLSRGSHTISAAYQGDANWNAGATASLSQSIQTTAMEPDPLDPSKYTLAVGGTSSNDTIYVSYSSAASQVLILVSGGTSYRANYDVANLAHIAIYGAAGKDLLRVNASVPVPALLFGGDGNDSLWAGSAGSVLVGGKGNDTLRGGSGRDVLVGGLGSDNLNGQGDQDILIGGTTDHDNDLAALELVMAEWKRTNATYTQRYKHLLGPDHGGFAGGLNGAVYLNPATVHDDATVDYLLGGAGTDWYFGTSSTNRDLLAARTLGEIITLYS